MWDISKEVVIFIRFMLVKNEHMVAVENLRNKTTKKSKVICNLH